MPVSHARSPLRQIARPTRWVLLLLTPIFVFIAVGAWVFATPAGASPDDDYHLNSIWCADGIRPGLCEPGKSDLERRIPVGLIQTICEKGKVDMSPACQTFHLKLMTTKRLNTDDGYPKMYYAIMGHFASPDLLKSIQTMRIFNVFLFVLLTVLLYWLLPPPRRATLVLGWTAVLVPLGTFLIASTNPSGWVFTGCGVAWLATVGYFEQTGWRKWGLAALSVAGVFMAAGTRGDGAVYVALAVIAATVLSARRDRSFWTSFVIPLPFIAAVVAYLFAKDAQQLLSVIHGQLGSSQSGHDKGKEAINVGIGLLFQNILNLPDLWLGSFGGGQHGSLGWFDVPLPYSVQAFSLFAFCGIVFWGIRSMSFRKALTMLGVLTVMSVVTLWFLQKSHFTVGTYVQPRYLYPGLIVLAGVAALEVGRRRLTMGVHQLVLITVSVTISYGAAMYYTLRRYVAAAPDDVFININAHQKWWWGYSWLPDPMRFWIIATIAFGIAVGLSLLLTVPRAGTSVASPETAPLTVAPFPAAGGAFETTAEPFPLHVPDTDTASGGDDLTEVLQPATH